LENDYNNGLSIQINFLLESQAEEIVYHIYEDDVANERKIQ